MKLIKIDENNISAFKADLASVHFGAYSKDHFTSCFSEKKLEKYYEYLVGASDLSFVVFDDNVIQGFVIAGYSVGAGVQRFISEEKSYLLRVFLRHPKFLVEKISTLLKSKFSKSKSSGLEVPFRLMSIAVRADGQSKGVGTNLVAFLERELPIKANGIYGLSVRKGNKRAVDFYLKHGFKIQKETRDSLYLYKELINE